MSDRQEERFDRQIKAALENAEEEVPEHVWAAISEQLDAIDAKKSRRAVIIPWLRRAGIGLAAAAAILLGVFLFVSPENKDFNEDTIAVVTEPQVEEGAVVEQETEAGRAVTEGATGQEAGRVVTEGASKYIAQAAVEKVVLPEEAGSEKVAEVAVPGEAGSEEVAEVAVPEEAGSEKVAEVAVSEEAGSEKVSDVWKDTERFDYVEETNWRSKSRMAITMSGNAISNSSSSSSSSNSNRQFASSVIKENSKGVTETSESSYNIPLSFGLGVKIIFTPRWSLGIGINYSLLSRSFAGTYTSYSSDTDSYITTNYSKIRNTQSYIGIPVNVYFSIISSKAVDFYAYAGGTGEKCACNKYVMDNIVYKKHVDGLQFSVNAGFGVEFIIADMVGLYVDPSIRYYFENSKQPTSIRTQEQLNFGFELGFRIRL